MAVNRMDPGKGEGDKGEKHAEAAPSAAAAPAAPAGMKAWLPLIAAVVLLPAIAYGVTTFILLPKLQQGLGLKPAASAHGAPAAGGHGEAAAGKGEGEGGKGEGAGGEGAVGPGGRVQVPLTKLIVNVSGTMASRFLMVSMIMVSTKPEFPKLVKEREAQLKDTAMTILTTKTISDLEKPGARNLIRSELITAFNHIFGGTTVQEIYFTDFAIQ
jgi:flagellar basal body-associated protein FliL